MNRWMPAFESQLQAVILLDRVLGMDKPELNRIKGGLLADRALLRHSVPYFWSKEIVDGLHQACHGVSMDATIDPGNLDIPAAWWHFEEPLPLITTGNVDYDGGVQAVCMGWMRDTRVPDYDGPPNTVKLTNEFWCSCWIKTKDDNPGPVTPSQTWTWREGEDLASLLGRLAAEYEHNYGPNGPFAEFAKDALIGEDGYLKIAIFLAKFILAGHAWVSQRIAAQTDGAVERHRRKDMERQTGRKVSMVKVVELRRVERPPFHPGATAEPGNWSHRWLVGGHWRNAAVGAGRTQRRLTYVHPYVKGPDDKPLIVKERVFKVTR